MQASELKLSLSLATLSGEPWSCKVGTRTKFGSLMAYNVNNDPIVDDLSFEFVIF